MKPCVKEMLEVAEACGLETVDEAYSNYMNHYDAFFLIDKYAEQQHALHSEMKQLRLIVRVEGKVDRWTIKDTSIAEAKERL